MKSCLDCKYYEENPACGWIVCSNLMFVFKGWHKKDGCKYWENKNDEEEK